MRNPWLKIGFDAWCLGFETASVISLRMLKIAAGGKAGNAESTRMIQEKLRANADLQVKAHTGGLGTTPLSIARTTLTHYSGRVRANKKRLMNPRSR